MPRYTSETPYRTENNGLCTKCAFDWESGEVKMLLGSTGVELCSLMSAKPMNNVTKPKNMKPKLLNVFILWAKNSYPLLSSQYGLSGSNKPYEINTLITYNNSLVILYPSISRKCSVSTSFWFVTNSDCQCNDGAGCKRSCGYNQQWLELVREKKKLSRHLVRVVVYCTLYNILERIILDLVDFDFDLILQFNQPETKSG